MRSFFFPRKLLAHKSAYTAALHRDQTVARQALISWMEGQHPDDLVYPQHKLAMLVYERFKEEPDLFTHFGVYKNIHRHCLLRAHVNLSSMNMLLADEALDGAEIFALGGTHLKLDSGVDIPCDLDAIEWGTSRQGQRAISEALVRAGATVVHPPRNIILRGASVQTFTDRNNCPIRLVAFNKVPALTKQKGRLSMMIPQAHLDFLASSQASVIARRDQYIFNLHSILDTITKCSPTGQYSEIKLPTALLGDLTKVLGVFP